MISSYSELPEAAKNGFMTGRLMQVRNVGTLIYRCFGVTLEIPFGDCPEVHFYNYFNK
jgi:hypothetical protein